MRILVLGMGKTGKMVADVAAERSHSVHVLDAKENANASALTPPFVAGFDVVIDFTTPEAAVQNMRACLATGAKMVIGTTGWYDKLPDMRGLAERKQAGLLYGTNFSIGVQVMLQLAKKMAEMLKDAGYEFSIEETHHTSKLDAPSGTAMSLATAVVEEMKKGPPVEGLVTQQNQYHVQVESKRVGDVAGIHTLIAKSDADRLVLTHESHSRRGFAEGAVRAAEWLSSRTGCYDFQDVYTKM
jgi:4-hydroxy-tetrahydrodipicolinate reductase